MPLIVMGKAIFMYLFSLDYLVGVVQKMHEEKIVTKSLFHNRTGINVVIRKLIEVGLVQEIFDTEIKKNYYKGTGRRICLYRLNVAYQDIRLGDLYPLLIKMGRHEQHVYHLMKDLPLSDLIAARDTTNFITTSYYGADKLLSLIFFLSPNEYVRCSVMEDMIKHDGDRRTILSDMVKSGILEVKRSYGYRLTKPSADIKISAVLHLLYSRNSRRMTYNTLLFLLRDKSVEVLRRNEGIMA